MRQNGAIYIEDLASFTGVRVNGAKIATPTPLREGDEVQIGDYRIALRGERTTARSRTAAITDRPTMPSMPAVVGADGDGGRIGRDPDARVRGGDGGAAGRRVPRRPARYRPPRRMPPVDTAPLASEAPARRTDARAGADPHAARSRFAASGARRRADPNRSRSRRLSLWPLPRRRPLGASHAGRPRVTPPRRASRRPRRRRPAAQAQAVAGVPDGLRGAADDPDSRPRRYRPRSHGRHRAGPMFVLTTDLAGMEFSLDRASLVIGRTDENDIVLRHRSISRHHAKIVRDGDHYTIVDLQSANGVRVNGEDYERIELNPGDIVELGHVKLRFVARSRRYVFDAAALGSGCRRKLAVGAAAVRGGAGGGRRRGCSQRQRVDAPPARRQRAGARAAAPSRRRPRRAARSPRGRRPRPAAATPEAILAEAVRPPAPRTGTRRGRRWTGSGARRRSRPRREAATLCVARWTRSGRARSRSRSSTRPRRRRTTPTRSRATRRSPPTASTSGARSRAPRGPHAAGRRAHGRAEQARAAGRCAEVHTEAEEISELDPQQHWSPGAGPALSSAGEPAPVAARRRRVAAAGRPAKPRPEPDVDARPMTRRARRAGRARARPPARSGRRTTPDPDALMKQAREAWLRQQCGSAMDLSRKALHAKPGMTDAYQIIAVCSCTSRTASGRARLRQARRQEPQPGPRALPEKRRRRRRLARSRTAGGRRSPAGRTREATLRAAVFSSSA